ncbi:hypothetical protein HOE04_02150 [archaeon]|jgi:hypothetical protein|nr:hypothetical protein [archaeon]
MDRKNLADKLKFVAQTGFLVPAIGEGIYGGSLLIYDFWINDCFYFKEQVTNVIGEVNYDGFQLIAPIVGIGSYIYSVGYCSNKINKFVDKIVGIDN